MLSFYRGGIVQLAATAGLTALVGERIHAVMLPQNSPYPALNFFMVAATRPSTMNADRGVVDGLWQVDIWAETITAARAVAVQVRTALKRYRGTPTGSGTEILDCFMENEFEDHEPEPPLHRVTQEYRVWWRE